MAGADREGPGPGWTPGPEPSTAGPRGYWTVTGHSGRGLGCRSGLSSSIGKPESGAQPRSGPSGLGLEASSLPLVGPGDAKGRPPAGAGRRLMESRLVVRQGRPPRAVPRPDVAPGAWGPVGVCIQLVPECGPGESSHLSGTWFPLCALEVAPGLTPLGDRHVWFVSRVPWCRGGPQVHRQVWHSGPGRTGVSVWFVPTTREC